MFKSKLSKQSLILFLVFCLAAILRLYRLNQVPPGFWFDESSFSYSAYSILRTGKSEFGHWLPVLFQSFGQYNAPLFFYYLIPFIAIFGLNIWAVRLASVFLGLGIISAIYLLAKELFDKKVALTTAFVVSLSPFALQFNRMMHENNLVALLVIFATLFFIKGIKANKYFYYSAIFFGLTFYTYLAARAFIPLFFISLVLIYKKDLPKSEQLIKPILVGFLVLVPFLISLTNQQAWQRVSGTGLWTDPGIVLRINEARGEMSSQFWARVLHNKPLAYFKTFFHNYWLHLDPRFWLLQGDPVEIYSTPNIGIMLFWEAPLFLFGLIKLFTRSKRSKLIFSWLLLAFIPAALTRFVPSASRSFIALPAISLFSGYGLASLYAKYKKHFILIFFFLILIIFNLIYYFHNYYVQLPRQYAYAWRRGIKPTMISLTHLADYYPKIIIDQESVNYSSVLFFLKTPPEEVQQQAKIVNIDQFGFGYIPQVNKFTFTREMPEVLEELTLYVGLCNDLESKGKILEQYTIDQEKSFCLVKK